MSIHVHARYCSICRNLRKLTNSPQGRINNLKLEMVMDIVEEMRGFEVDHEPEGWPAVQMKQVSALCDEIDALRAELQKAREQEPVIQIENGIVVNFNPNYDGDVSNGEFYAAPVPAMPMQDDTCGCSDCEEGFPCSSSKAIPIPKQESAVSVHDDGLTDSTDYVQSIINKSSRASPRITEQDAREIINTYIENKLGVPVNEWMTPLLNKLNANAVASQAAAIPDKKYIIDPRNDDGEYYLLGSDIIAMLSASPKPE